MKENIKIPQNSDADLKSYVIFRNILNNMNRKVFHSAILAVVNTC